MSLSIVDDAHRKHGYKVDIFIVFMQDRTVSVRVCLEKK